MIHYTDGREWEPTETGVYACRIPSEIPGFYEDKFLMWIDGQWCHLGSDQKYRGDVRGFAGPLKRRLD